MVPVEPGSDAVLLDDTVERLLRATCTFAAVEAAEAPGWCEPVWRALAEAGLPWVSVAESAGGSGGSLTDALIVVRRCGQYAAPVPIAETGIIGGWLLESGALPVPAGPVAVIPDAHALRVANGRVTGTARVAWAAAAHVIAALVAGPDGWIIVSARPEQLEITRRANLAGEPRVDVRLADVQSSAAPDGVDSDALRRRGALARIMMMAGATEAMSQMTIDYAHGRYQFGRPIAAFQAVQQHLVIVAQAAVRIGVAAELAARAAATGDARLEIATAKVIADRSTVEGTRAAHQVHGAMGVTREYRLHHLSRRLWAWRHEYGRAREWRREIGSAAVAAGPDNLFPLITG